MDLDIELPGSAWHPVQPPATGLTTGTVWFIDGVRRLEARVTAQADGRYCHGAFGSYAVGAVRLDAREAGFDRHITGRLFALASALQPGGEPQVAPGLVYLPLRVAGSEPEAPLRAIHNEMRLAEETRARKPGSWSWTGLSPSKRRRGAPRSEAWRANSGVRSPVFSRGFTELSTSLPAG